MGDSKHHPSPPTYVVTYPGVSILPRQHSQLADEAISRHDYSPCDREMPSIVLNTVNYMSKYITAFLISRSAPTFERNIYQQSERANDH